MGSIKQKEHLKNTADQKKEQTRQLIIRTCEYILDNGLDGTSYLQLATASKIVDPLGKGRTAPTFKNDEYRDILLSYQLGDYARLDVETNGMVDMGEIVKLQKEIIRLKRQLTKVENKYKEQLKNKAKEIKELQRANEVLRNAIQSKSRLEDIVGNNVPVNIVNNN